MGTPAVQVGERVYRFPTLGDYVNTMAIVQDDGSVTLIDCGTKKAPAHIVKGLAAIGKHPKDVQRIVLTHSHEDHAGGAAGVVDETGVAGVDCHEAEAQYVETGTAPPRDETLLSGRIFQRLPMGGFVATPVANRLTDGELLDNELRVHHTPGHTPGHIALVHEPSGVLVTGDSIWNMASRRTWPVSAFCSDHLLNRKTAHVLGELEYQTVAFIHGPHIDTNARETIRGFLKSKGY